MLRKRNTQDSDKPEKEKSITKSVSKKKSSNIIIKLILAILFVLYVMIPFSVYYFPTARRHAVFLHYVSLSRHRNLSNPEESGLTCTQNFFISSGNGIKLGTWHIPPSSAMKKCKKGHLPEGKEFDDGLPVFLYLHGNAGTRAGYHRVELYKIFSEKLNAHVVAFDYRGFGDSSSVSPSEPGLVEDTKYVYEWLLQRVDSSRIYVWGHSLGTGVSVAFLHQLKSKIPAALVLEAPFTSIYDAAKFHPISIFHRFMPFFDLLIAKPLGDSETGFDSVSRINQVKCPIMILHAEDDGFVPFDLGKQLYEVGVKTRKDPSDMQFEVFEGHLDFGHKNIYKSPKLPSIIKNFMDKAKLKIKKKSLKL